MRTFYLEKSQFIAADKAVILGGDVHHLKNVLRVKVGDELNIRSFGGEEYRATVVKIDQQITLALSERRIISSSHQAITLFLGIPKMPTLKSLVRQITELDVATLQLVEMERSEVKIKTEHLEKLKKISKEAMKQCLRSNLMKIPPVVKFKEIKSVLVNNPTAEPNKFLAYEGLASTHDSFQFTKEIKENISLWVGPEGGISLTEKEHLEQLGFIPVSLGKNILRVDTAVLFFLGKFL